MNRDSVIRLPVIRLPVIRLPVIRGLVRGVTGVRAFTVLATIVGALVFSSPSVDAGDKLIILQPGYPGSTKDAREFVDDFCKTLTTLGAALSGGEYHNDEPRGLEAVERDRPAIGIVSLGVFLKHRERLALRPLLVSTPHGSCRLLVKSGTIPDLKSLSGKTVTSTAFAEPEFVERVILGNATDKPAGALCADWKTSRAKSFNRGLRKLKKGRCDAVLLNSREFDGYENRLKKPEDGFVVLHTSRAFPTAVVVVFGKVAPDEGGKKWLSAFKELPRSEKGKKLLANMGTQGFVPVDDKTLEPFQKLFDHNATVETRQP